MSTIVDCSTPPTRTEAFEDFKKDAGSEIHRILVENKGKQFGFEIIDKVPTGRIFAGISKSQLLIKFT